tara:strand:+ start:402 stop:986 length:585 start_codon:yes stop_codon:yes gene_type:complete
MHTPEDFKISDEAEIFTFIERNAFGQLISISANKLVSTHMPFLLSDDRTKLLGHLARANPQHQDLENQEIMITLEGPHDYVSPSWYVGPGVPTWNYQAVHIYGTCRILNNIADLQKIVDRLTNKYEQPLTPPWVPDYNPAMLKYIVGVEISIQDVQCKYKLSQNKSEQDREQVISGLEGLGSDSLAQAMRNLPA